MDDKKTIVPFSKAFTKYDIDLMLILTRKYVKHNKMSTLAAIRRVTSEYPQYAQALRRKYQRYNEGKTGQRSCQILSFEKETVLVGRLQAYSRLGQAYSYSQLRNEVIEIANLEQDWDASSWFRSFKKRTVPHLKFSKLKSIDACRINDINWDSVRDFIHHTSNLFEKLSFQSSFVFNIDESPSDSLNMNLKVMVDSNYPHSGVMKLAWDSLRTAVPIVAADGSIFMILLIYQDGSKKAPDTKIEPWSRASNHNGLRNCIDYYYATTARGYMTNDLWRQLVNLFVTKLVPILNGANALLYLDRLSSHMDESSLERLVSSNVQVLYLPPHTTHLVQPLDQFPLANYKKNLTRLKHKELHRRLNEKISLNGILSTIIHDAIVSGFTPSSIVSSFKKTGLYPWNESTFRDRFDCDTPSLQLTRSEKKYDKIRIKSLQSVLNEHKQHVKKNKKRKRRQSAADLPALGSMTIEAIKERKENKKNPSKRPRTPTVVVTNRISTLEYPQLDADVVSQVENELDFADLVEMDPAFEPLKKLTCSGCFDKFDPTKFDWSCTKCHNAQLCGPCSTSVFYINAHQCLLSKNRFRSEDDTFSSQFPHSIIEISSETI